MRRARRRRRKAKRGKTLKQWFINLSKKKKIALIAALVLLIVIIFILSFVASKYNKMDIDEFEPEEIIINDLPNIDLGDGYTNFVVFGSDSRSDNVTKNLNTDSIIIVSLNNETKEVKMISLYRDTLLDMTNGSIQKCNSAYARGGAKQAINMLNMNLDLDIRKYVTVNFSAVADVVDMLGGITVDVSEAEVKATNKYIKETARVVGQKPVYLEEAGVQTLNGVQATTYARIRKGVGDDYARTERQRLVITKVVEKVMQSNLATINDIIDAVLPNVSTNFTMTEIVSYASHFLEYSIGESSGFPFEKGSGIIGRRGSCVYPMALETNVQMLHEFLFGTVDYQPSSKVAEISGEIDELVGRYTSGGSSSSSSSGSSGSSSSSENASDETPSATLEDSMTPSEEPETTPSDETETTPPGGTESTPSTGTETTPSEGTESTPSTEPETTPSEEPETTPSEEPETTPSEEPERTPSEKPETTPSEESETTPSEESTTTVEPSIGTP